MVLCVVNVASGLSVVVRLVGYVAGSYGGVMESWVECGMWRLWDRLD